MWTRKLMFGLAVTSTAMFLLAVSNLIQSERSTSGAIVAGEHLDVEMTDTSSIAGQSLLKDRETVNPALIVTFSLANLDPALGRLEGTVRVEGGEGLDQALTSLRPEGSQFSRTFIAQAREYIVLEIDDALGRKSITTSFDIKRLNPVRLGGRPSSIDRPFSFQLVSLAKNYPNDEYVLASELSSEIFGSYPRSRRHISGLPMDLRVQPSPNLGGMALEAQQQEDPRQLALVLTFVRDRSTTRFVYLVALAPVILILIAFLSLITQGRESRVVTLELGLGLLAILPLREVLVPPNVPGITFLDLILGAEIGAIISVIAWRYAIGFSAPTRATRQETLW